MKARSFEMYCRDVARVHAHTNSRMRFCVVTALSCSAQNRTGVFVLIPLTQNYLDFVIKN